MSVGECLWIIRVHIPFVLLHKLTFMFLFQTDSVGPDLSLSRDKKDKIFDSVLTTLV